MVGLIQRTAENPRRSEWIRKDLNFEIGWLLNCCNHGFSGFLVPQKRKMKNNVSQSLDLESFLLLQEEKEKNIFRLSRFNSYLAFFSCSVASESPSSIFSQTHFRSKVLSLSVVKTSVGWKACLNISLEEPYSIFWQECKSPVAQKNKGSLDLDRFTRSGQSSYIMVPGSFSHISKWDPATDFATTFLLSCSRVFGDQPLLAE